MRAIKLMWYYLILQCNINMYKCSSALHSVAIWHLEKSSSKRLGRRQQQQRLADKVVNYKLH